MGIVTIVTVLNDSLDSWAKNLKDVDFYDSRDAERDIAIKMIKTMKGDIYDSVTYARLREKMKPKILRAQIAVQKKFISTARKNSMHAILLTSIPRKCGIFIEPTFKQIMKRKVVSDEKYKKYITDKMANGIKASSKTGICQLMAQDLYELEHGVFCSPGKILEDTIKMAQKNNMIITMLKFAKRIIRRNLPPQ